MDIELNEIDAQEDEVIELEEEFVDYISSLLGRINGLSGEEIFDELLSLDTIPFDKKD